MFAKETVGTDETGGWGRVNLLEIVAPELILDGRELEGER